MNHRGIVKNCARAILDYLLCEPTPSRPIISSVHKVMAWTLNLMIFLLLLAVAVGLFNVGWYVVAQKLPEWAQVIYAVLAGSPGQ